MFLTLASLFFFFWGSGKQTVLIIFSICVNYALVKIIDQSTKERLRTYTLAVGVTINLALLFYFKYANFFIDNLNFAFSSLGLANINLPKILLPIGISFFTFHSISYLIDVYRKNALAQHNLINYAMYITFFPQLIAGPIVRYKDIHTQINNRHTTVEQFTEGVSRFLFGLAKKVIIADSMGVVADTVFKVDATQFSTGAAWVALFAYTFQIYFDFSGYSDMAIGLAKMFGFNFLENFNYPYISKSISEFWRRWHISLSSCFKDYMYIPLGGNRGSKLRTFFNLYMVFFFCGLWHGANWAFVAWGLFHGTFLVFERTRFRTVLEQLPAIVQRLYCMLVVMIGWVFFRSESFSYGWNYIERLFSLATSGSYSITAISLLDSETIALFCLAALGATPIINTWQRFMNSDFMIYKCNLQRVSLLLAREVLASGFFAFIFIVSVGKLAAQSYNPFIYFKF